MSEADVTTLAAENAALRNRIAELEAQLAFLGQHRTLAAGIVGERLIERLTGGALTPHTADHDIRIGDDQIEVKFSNLSRPIATAPTLRWQWQKIYGQTGGKNYSQLLLIGAADARYRHLYADPASPYVFFLLPFDEARPLCVKGNPLGIVLSSNPLKAKGSSKILFEKWQVSPAEVEARFMQELPEAAL